MEPKASVIIPTRGRDACLRQVVRDLDAQDFSDFDVYVVDQNDTPLPALQAEARKITVHHEPMKPLGSHAGRNLAIFKSSAPICIFVDDDVRLDPKFVRAHVEAHEHAGSNVAVIAGRVVQPKDGLTDEQMILQGKLARYNPVTGSVSGNFIGTERGLVDHMHECNFSARTDLLRAVGAFNTEFAGNAYFEGTDLSLRIQEKGYAILYYPEISLIHLQDGVGGNRVQDKAKHTYWMMRNQSLLNSYHMKRVGLPIFEAVSLAYVLGKAIKNRDPEIALQGLKGLGAGLSFFVEKRK